MVSWSYKKYMNIYFATKGRLFLSLLPLIGEEPPPRPPYGNDILSSNQEGKIKGYAKPSSLAGQMQDNVSPSNLCRQLKEETQTFNPGEDPNKYNSTFHESVPEKLKSLPEIN